MQSNVTQIDTEAPLQLSSLTPEEYANNVDAVFRCTAEAYRYPGSSIERLAHYLQRAVRPSNQNRKRYTAPEFPFAYIIRNFDQPVFSSTEDTVHAASEQLSRPEDLQDAASLIFLRGQPSSEWLVRLGAMYHVDPDFFQRHLDFLSTAGRENHYVLPSLPSASDSIIQLSYYTISRSPVLKGVLDDIKLPEGVHKLRGIDGLRRRAEIEMDSYITERTQHIDNNAGVGDSIVRDFYIFDNLRFALKQQMTLTVVTSGDEEKWTALAWSDTGKDLSQGARGPWTDYLKSYEAQHKLSGPASFLPTVQIRPFDAMRSQKAQQSNHNAKFAQSSALIHTNYGESLDHDLVHHDAFYLFQELFEFCAFSTVQFLNLVEERIAMGPISSRDSDSEARQTNLLYLPEVLAKTERDLEGNIQVIHSRGMNWWHGPQDERQRKRCQQAAESLRRDYDALLDRTTKLRQRCQTQINNLAAQATLAESKKAMHQANEVAKLTKMAFFFIPISFTCGLFGMNVSPIVDDAPPIWIWVTVTVPIILVSFLFLRWSPLRLYPTAQDHNSES